MGFFDKIKGAMNAVTGGGAKVSLEFQPPIAHPGHPLHVRITVVSTGGEIKSKGVFVDLVGNEVIKLPKGTVANQAADIHATKASFQQEFQISPAFVLGANETKMFEGAIQLPPALEPSYTGALAKHEWKIQGRMEATGNDPDSGWLDIRIGRAN